MVEIETLWLWREIIETFSMVERMIQKKAGWCWEYFLCCWRQGGRWKSKSSGPSPLTEKTDVCLAAPEKEHSLFCLVRTCWQGARVCLACFQSHLSPCPVWVLGSWFWSDPALPVTGMVEVGGHKPAHGRTPSVFVFLSLCWFAFQINKYTF